MIARYLATGFLILVMALSGIAGAEVEPTSRQFPVRPQSAVARLDLAPVDAAAALAEDEDRRAAGDPERFALPDEVFITPEQDGTWEELPAAGLALWRLRITAPGCVSLNLGFERYRLPAGGRLVMHAADGTGPVHEFTAADNADHGQLWTPLLESDEIVVELTLPLTARHDADLWLTRVGKGYRPFVMTDPAKSGYCNIDVNCPEGDQWRREIPSVGVYSIYGFLKCTGVLINNTAEDGTPYFATAAHCDVTVAAAPTLVVYWNFESPVCGDQSGGSLDNFQTGAIHRSTWEPSDSCLLELEEDPDPALNLSWAGWSREDLAPEAAVGIHHPSTDEKSISFEDDPLEFTSQFAYDSPGDALYLRVIDWDAGTTEVGSSGSPLFDPWNRIVGLLWGGLAGCGNNDSDWYGRLNKGWEGGFTPDTSFKDWLDPLGLGSLVLDTRAPWAGGMHVTAAGDLVARGEWGGPFSPTEQTYVIANQGEDPLDYAVTAQDTWVEVTGGTGTLAAGATTTVTVTIGTEAEGFLPGVHTTRVFFTNSTDGDGDTMRPVYLEAGSYEVRYSWNLDEDPLWDREGLWAWGVPQGLGGTSGNPDPTAGYTGTTVLGYNLDGDYEPNLGEMNLTTGPIDCRLLREVTLRYRRWLGVQSASFDHASVQASTDGLDWVPVWANTAQVMDDDWQMVQHDLSAIADYGETVYLRWVMGSTNPTAEFCGWNIDDIEILGREDLSVGIDDPVDTTPPAALPEQLAVRSRPNPFNPRTTIAFDLPRSQQVQVAVHDATGRRVRVLYEDRAAAGTTEVVWNGDDARGRRQASGIYFVRVVGEFQETTHKISLLK